MSRSKDGKLEVVFFPYKAAMSDSMKSIYLAAKADPNCDAYWCPIPYCDWDENKEPKRVYYEGDLYGNEFQVIDWKQYDVEERHPDIIFTHFGYDEVNKMTGVSDIFFTSHLKKCTDLLVYVDYGLTWWICKSMPSKLGDDEPWVPAYWHSDVVITHTREFAKTLEWHMMSCWKMMISLQKKSKLPDIVECHMKEFLQDMGGEEGKIPEGRLVPLGSPKFDLILKDSRENHELPEEWKKQIGNRKILLYNTAWKGLANDPDYFLGDISYVIRKIASRDDIILWWRPHPLMERMARLESSEIGRGYRKLVEKFRRKKLGIYDDTHDLQRAISWSDGCLTNESSLLWLYLATGKPFTLLARNRMLKNPAKVDDGTDFRAPLLSRLANMRAGKGANPNFGKPGWEWCCVWWENFLPEDKMHGVHYDHFLERFVHYIVHRGEYPEAEEYEALQRQIFKDFIVNPDGTAGEKIYDYCRKRVLSDERSVQWHLVKQI